MNPATHYLFEMGANPKGAQSEGAQDDWTFLSVLPLFLPPIWIANKKSPFYVLTYFALRRIGTKSHKRIICASPTNKAAFFNEYLGGNIHLTMGNWNIPSVKLNC